MAYNLGFYVTDVDSSAGPNIRYYGFSLRCLSTVLDMEKNLIPQISWGILLMRKDLKVRRYLNFPAARALV